MSSDRKIAMSKALGNAFLSHQVQLLEKSVDKKRPRPRFPKDADIVVVDASVLIHALYQIKKWCREGRQEVIIIPLEALNTLDLLKKGTSPTAQRARAASRILEAQVGTNPRIRVQQDDAFVPWDKIPVSDSPSQPCPEWVRRVISCARWEAEHANNLKVILAVLGAPAESATPSPVPLPPLHNQSKHEGRSTGALVHMWAQHTGVAMISIEPSNANHAEVDVKRRSPPRPAPAPHALVERPPTVMAMMQPSKVIRVLARGEKLDNGP